MFKHTLYLIAGCLALVLSLAFGSQTAFAGPPNPQVFPASQPDGTTFQARLWGDEWANGVETKEGYSILRNTQGYWVYAVSARDGSLTTGSLIVGKNAPSGVKTHLRPSTTSRPKMDMPRSASGGELAPRAIGTQPVLILLAQFLDRPAVGTNAAYWKNLFFGASGKTVKTFYSSASFGKFGIAPAPETYGTGNDGVVGWLTLPYNHPNTGSAINDLNRQIVRDIVLAANPYVNYATFDTNGDGYISSTELHIVVIVAGYDTSYSGNAFACGPDVWGHHAALGDTVPAPVVDGKRVGDGAHGGGYTQEGEWHCATWAGGSPGHAATMGPVTHELGHDINLPDLYDTDGSAAGIGQWGIMGSGLWNTTPGGNEGDTPYASS